MSFLFNILEPINLYGLNFPLRYKKEETYPTITGIILSIITIFFVIAISILYGMNIIYKTGYSLVTNYVPLRKKTLIDFSNRPIMFGFATNGGIMSYIEPSLISLTFDRNVHNVYLDENGIYQLQRISTKVEMESCNKSKHFINKNDFMEYFEYNKFLCAKPNQNLSFGGRFGDNINGYDILEIHLNKCVNTTENNNKCKSEDTINKFLKNSYLIMVYLSESVDHSNTSNPLVETLRNELYIVAKEHVKRYYQYFQIANYNSDVGLIWNKIKKFDLTETKSVHTDFVKEEDQDFYTSNALLEIAFTSTDQRTIYERKYVKLQEILGDIGGFTDIVFVFFQFISNYFSKKTMIVDITNKIIMKEDKRNIKFIIPNNSYYLTANYSFSSSRKNQFTNSELKLMDVPKTKTMTVNYLNNNYIDKPIKTCFKSEDLKGKNINKKINKNKKERKFKISCYHYIWPIELLAKCKKYDSLAFYTNIFYKYMSIEVIIPLIERLSKIDLSQKENNDTHYFKLSTSVLNSPKKKREVMIDKKIYNC